MNTFLTVRHFILVTAIAGTTLSLQVGAQGMQTFADFDLDKDGKITEAEFDEVRAARISKRATEGYQMRGLANAPTFAEIDSNHDGALSPSEFSAQQAQHQKPRR